MNNGTSGAWLLADSEVWDAAGGWHTLQLSGHRGTSEVLDLGIVSPACSVKSRASLVQMTRGSSAGLVVLLGIMLIAASSVVVGVFAVLYIKRKRAQQEAIDRHVAKTIQEPFAAAPLEPLEPLEPRSTFGEDVALRAGSVQLEAPKFLCPELSVPVSSECVLVLPSLRIAPHGDVVLRDITDKSGRALLRVGLTSSHQDVARATASEYVLLAKTNDQELAFAELYGGSTPRGTTEQGKMFFWNGTLHGKLWEDPSATLPVGDQAESTSGPLHCFVVVGVNDQWKLRFQGNFLERKVCVLNDATQIVAIVVPADDDVNAPSGSYKLRLGPLADSGLIILALFTIDRLLRSQRSEWSGRSSTMLGLR